RVEGGVVFGGAGEVVADGPAIRRRSARYSKKVVEVPGAGVRRGNDGPRCPVPMLDQRLAEGILAGGPAIRRRSARHIKELVVLGGARVGRVDDGPRCPVPMLDERLAEVAVAVGADGPAVRG